jgi:hypothetical protein
VTHRGVIVAREVTAIAGACCRSKRSTVCSARPDVEAIELFPRSSSIPLSYQVPNAQCGIMVVWFNVP